MTGDCRGASDFDLDVELTPQASATLAVSRFNAHPKGLFRLVFPAFMMAMRRPQAKAVGDLKRVLEAYHMRCRMPAQTNWTGLAPRREPDPQLLIPPLRGSG